MQARHMLNLGVLRYTKAGGSICSSLSNGLSYSKACVADVFFANVDRHSPS